MVESIVIGLLGAAGILGGWFWARTSSRKIVDQARGRSEKNLAQARKDAALTLREVETHAQEEALAVRSSFEGQHRQLQEENTLIEERIQKHEKRQQSREGELQERQNHLDWRRDRVRSIRGEAKAVRLKAKDHKRQYREGVAEKAGQTPEEIKAAIGDALIEETKALCADRLRNLEATSSEEFMRQAKRIMGIAIGRYGTKVLLERKTSSLSLSPEGVSKLKAKPDTLNTIEDLTGIRLVLGDNGDTMRFEGGDGVAKELARRVVTRFVSKDDVADLPQLVQSLSAELDKSIQDKGKEAFRILGIEPAHPEIVNLVGRLNYRTSYTQNQWQHCIEASVVAGLMAAEIGLDVTLARRSTLLHDIGKALTHEVEGSHAVIGGEYARKYGEEEIIANAIAAHHGDEPPQSPYAYLVAAADAMSGARPGARREMVEAYVDRIAELERITNHFSGVVAVHAVQAGRELRVHVDEKKVDDARAAQLSESIAEKVSQELTFPGQIRVMVIREFKAVELAS